jgi:hypothetical protein
LFTNFGGGAETDNNSAETDKSGYTSKYQYFGPPLVAVPKNTIAVPKQKKICAETDKIQNAEKSAETGGNLLKQFN